MAKGERMVLRMMSLETIMGTILAMEIVAMFTIEVQHLYRASKLASCWY
jgi:hypothetical protein